MKPDVQLIYFDGCPHAAHAKAVLDDLGVAYVAVRQDDLAPADSRGAYSSPTILLDGRVIHGAALSGAGGGCSVEPPDAGAIAKALRAAGVAVRG